MTEHEELSKQLHENQMANKSYRNLPQRIMMQRWEDCGRDVFKFWDSIEWDSSWLRFFCLNNSCLAPRGMSKIEQLALLKNKIDKW